MRSKDDKPRAEAFWDVADALSENRCSMSDQRLGHAQTDRDRIEAFVARFANPHCICWLPADTDAVLDMLAEVRADEREACAQMFAASAVQRVRALERERDAALARVQELEAALREIAAVDSASPEHRIAMRALEPTQTARLPAGCACGGEGWCDACQIATRRAPR